MEQKTLSNWLKIIVIGVALCGIVVYAMIIPSYGRSLVSLYPEFSNRYVPWLIFLELTALPIIIALVLAWRIAGNIGRDKSFTMENASHLARIAQLAALDTGYFFIGNLVLLFSNMSHPGIVLFSLLVDFVGIAVTVAAAVLSHLVKKAADLQEQSDLTI